MKVLLTKAFFKTDLDYIYSRLNSEVELIMPESFDEETILNYAPHADVFFGAYFTESILTAAKNLKLIQIPWTGVNTLDFDLLDKFDVTVCNSHSNSYVVAEHAISLMMDAAKKISYHDRLMREGNWNRPGLNENDINAFSKTLFNSKIGIVGFGAIGKDIYNMMEGFKCRFKAFNRTSKPIIDAENISFHAISEVYAELSDLDFVIISIPLTDNTQGLIDQKFLESMNKKSVLVNISRGEVVNEEDLFKALDNKTIASATIDTWFNYPNKNNPIAFPSLKYSFHELSNIVLSPHRAGFVDGGFPHLDDAIENLNRLVSNRELINVVSLKKGY
jgi:lactate dehydrogenase-like 2-hydroxyacid dehydrogenase